MCQADKEGEAHPRIVPSVIEVWGAGKSCQVHGAPQGIELLGHEVWGLGRWVEVTPECPANEPGTLSPGCQGAGRGLSRGQGCEKDGGV